MRFLRFRLGGSRWKRCLGTRRTGRRQRAFWKCALYMRRSAHVWSAHASLRARPKCGSTSTRVRHDRSRAGRQQTPAARKRGRRTRQGRREDRHAGTETRRARWRPGRTRRLCRRCCSTSRAAPTCTGPSFRAAPRAPRMPFRRPRHPRPAKWQARQGPAPRAG